ncbi:DUF5050 domain-containing protein [Candidatus Bathyarchaeota archaeon]|nr:MAG: DUF5050 domain-containing protein [Candidatus Bathyarchaeota archaeon]
MARYRFILLLAITIFCLTTFINVKAEDTLTVKGTLKAPDQSGVNQPVRNAKVKIYDEESYYFFGSWVHLPWGDDYIKTVYTNDNGFFSTSINNDDGSSVFGDENGRDIYLVIESENTHTKLTKGPSWRPLKGLFKYQTATKRERSSEANFGTITITGETGTAFDILSNIELGWRFVRDQTGIHLPKANVYYKDGIFTPGESYCLPDSIGAIIIDPVKVEPLPVWLQPYPLATWGLTALNELAGIHLSEDNMDGERRYEIIFHEYGHYVMDKIGDLSPPWPVMLHESDTPYSEEHAFIEGFAEFFSAAARKEYGLADALELGGGNDIDSLEPIRPENRAAEIEFNVAAVLWDIYDDVDEPWDDSNIDFNTIINTIINYDPDPSSTWYTGQDHPWTIYEFFEGYTSAHPGDPTIPLIWRILEHYNIDTGIEDKNPPTTPTGYTSSHNSFILRDDDTIEVNLEGVTDDFSGVAYYKYRFITHPDQEPDFWMSTTSPHITSIPLYDDTWYLLVYAQDYAGNIGERYITGPLLVGDNPFIELDGALARLDLVYIGYQTSGDLTVTSRPNKLNSWVGQAFQIPYLMDNPETIGTIDFSNPELHDGPFQLKVIGQYLDPKDNEEDVMDLVCDKTSPDITLKFSGPNISQDPKHVNRDTVFKVTAADIGIGVKSIEYRFGDTEPWITYFNPIQTPALPDGSINFEVRATDFLENEATLSFDILIDGSGPNITIINPANGAQINDEATFQTVVIDETGIDWVKYSIRNVVSPYKNIGYNGLSAELQNGYWELDFDSGLLPDGEYILSVESSDLLGNKATISSDLIIGRAIVPTSVQKIALTSDRDGDSEIYLIDIDGTGLTRLTNNSNSDEQPYWSPDGSKIIFQSDRDGNMEIYVMNSDGSGQTRLTNNRYDDLDPCWSPDGSQIVFTSKRDDNYEIYVMNHDGSMQTRLTNNNAIEGEACWSPDGSKIAFASNRDTDYEIYIMNSDGSELTQLTSNFASDGDPNWSPDGAKIVFNTDRNRNYELYTINVDGSEETRLTINGAMDGQPIWSPDGEMIAFTSSRDGDYEIYVMNADGTNQTNLTNDNGYDYGASWVKIYPTVIDQLGVEADFNGDLLKVDDLSYSVNELPLLWSWAQGSTHSYVWVSPLDVSNSKRYVWVSTSGLSGENSDTFAVAASDNLIVGNYHAEYYVDIKQPLDGSITPISDWYMGSYEVRILATPSKGYEFTHWGISGGLVVSDEKSQDTLLSIEGPGSVEAYFVKSSFTLSASASSGGEITPSGNVAVIYGGDQGFTFTPLEGYEVEDVLVDDVSIGAVDSYSFTNVVDNHIIKVGFQQSETERVPGFQLAYILVAIVVVLLVTRRRL